MRSPDLARGAALTLAVAGVTLAAAAPAAATCVTLREGRELERALRDEVRCRHRALQGKLRPCKLRPAPACAEALFGDALALVYGPNDPPAAPVDGRTLRQPALPEGARRGGGRLRGEAAARARGRAGRGPGRKGRAPRAGSPRETL